MNVKRPLSTVKHMNQCLSTQWQWMWNAPCQQSSIWINVYQHSDNECETPLVNSQAYESMFINTVTMNVKRPLSTVKHMNQCLSTQWQWMWNAPCQQSSIWINVYQHSDNECETPLVNSQAYESMFINTVTMNVKRPLWTVKHMNQCLSTQWQWMWNAPCQQSSIWINVYQHSDNECETPLVNSQAYESMFINTVTMNVKRPLWTVKHMNQCLSTQWQWMWNAPCQQSSIWINVYQHSDNECETPLVNSQAYESMFINTVTMNVKRPLWTVKHMNQCLSTQWQWMWNAPCQQSSIWINVYQHSDNECETPLVNSQAYESMFINTVTMNVKRPLSTVKHMNQCLSTQWQWMWNAPCQQSSIWINVYQHSDNECETPLVNSQAYESMFINTVTMNVKRPLSTVKHMNQCLSTQWQWMWNAPCQQSSIWINVYQHSDNECETPLVNSQAYESMFINTVTMNVKRPLSTVKHMNQCLSTQWQWMWNAPCQQSSIWINVYQHSDNECETPLVNSQAYESMFINTVTMNVKRPLSTVKHMNQCLSTQWQWMWNAPCQQSSIWINVYQHSDNECETPLVNSQAYESMFINTVTMNVKRPLSTVKHMNQCLSTQWQWMWNAPCQQSSIWINVYQHSDNECETPLVNSQAYESMFINTVTMNVKRPLSTVKHMNQCLSTQWQWMWNAPCQQSSIWINVYQHSDNECETPLVNSQAYESMFINTVTMNVKRPLSTVKHMNQCLSTQWQWMWNAPCQQSSIWINVDQHSDNECETPLVNSQAYESMLINTVTMNVKRPLSTVKHMNQCWSTQWQWMWNAPCQQSSIWINVDQHSDNECETPLVNSQAYESMLINTVTMNVKRPLSTVKHMNQCWSTQWQWMWNAPCQQSSIWINVDQHSDNECETPLVNSQAYESMFINTVTMNVKRPLSTVKHMNQCLSTQWQWMWNAPCQQSSIWINVYQHSDNECETPLVNSQAYESMFINTVTMNVKRPLSTVKHMNQCLSTQWQWMWNAPCQQSSIWINVYQHSDNECETPLVNSQAYESMFINTVTMNVKRPLSTVKHMNQCLSTQWQWMWNAPCQQSSIWINVYQHSDNECETPLVNSQAYESMFINTVTMNVKRPLSTVKHMNQCLSTQWQWMWNAPCQQSSIWINVYQHSDNECETPLVNSQAYESMFINTVTMNVKRPLSTVKHIVENLDISFRISVQCMAIMYILANRNDFLVRQQQASVGFKISVPCQMYLLLLGMDQRPWRWPVAIVLPLCTTSPLTVRGMRHHCLTVLPHPWITALMTCLSSSSVKVVVTLLLFR